jgi:hypothetical protein
MSCSQQAQLLELKLRPLLPGICPELNGEIFTPCRHLPHVRYGSRRHPRTAGAAVVRVFVGGSSIVHNQFGDEVK